MSETTSTDTNIESSMDKLASKNGMIRQKARESLVVLGKPAVSSLNKALQESLSDQVRWEAAKALGEIGDTRSIPPLVKALADSNTDVAWLAAEALSEFKTKAWPTLLRALMINGPNSDLFRQGTHHVLLNQKEDGFDDLLETLMKALEPCGVPELAVGAAYNILQRMKDHS